MQTKVFTKLCLYTFGGKKKVGIVMMDDFYFDQTVSGGLDELEGMMREVREGKGRVWFRFGYCLCC
jgi:hypothetical protein